MDAGEHVHVLVVGAGPIGLALACHLRRLGLSVRVIEKRSGPSEHSKAIGLQYRVSEILARLGIVDRFIARGGSPTTVNIHAGQEQLLRLQFIAPSGVSGRSAFLPKAILLPQTETEALLIEHLRELGGAVEWQTEFVSYIQHLDRVVANIRRIDVVETIESEWLVSCEGAHSLVRKQAGISFDGKIYPLAFFMADVRMEGRLSHAENHVWLHEEGSLAALPLPSPGVWRLFIEVTRQTDRRASSLTIEALRDLVASRAPDLQATIVGEPLWLSDFRINCRLVDRMQDGRVFLAGDAAHIHSPTGGQGITTGMQDAVNLAWKLARVAAGAPPVLLSTYNEERRPHAAEVLRETDRTTNILFAPTPWLRLLRDIAVLPLLRRPWVQRRLFGKLSQLHVHYRGSSLSEDRRKPWNRRALRAGDRAPDVSFGRRDGTQTTLFALMGSMRPVVLFNGGTWSQLGAQLRSLDVEAYTVDVERDGRRDSDAFDLTDDTGDFAALYGMRRDFICLIRPDGHLGFVATATECQQLRAYLKRLCDPAEVDRAFG